MFSTSAEELDQQSLDADEEVAAQHSTLQDDHHGGKPSGDEEDEIDEVVGKICDFVLEYCGGAGGNNFDAIVRVVESAVASFMNKLLNDLAACPSVIRCTQHGDSAPGSTPNFGGVSGEPSAGQGESGPEGGPSGDGTEDGSGEGRDGPPGSGRNGEPDGDSPPARSSNYSCPYRKRNPNRFNPIDFHSCATTAWATLALLK